MAPWCPYSKLSDEVKDGKTSRSHQRLGRFLESNEKFGPSRPTHLKVGLDPMKHNLAWDYMLCKAVTAVQGCVDGSMGHFNWDLSSDTFMK